MTQLGDLKYVEVEFLAEWMGHAAGSKDVILETKANDLEKRNILKILTAGKTEKEINIEKEKRQKEIDKEIKKQRKEQEALDKVCSCSKDFEEKIKEARDEEIEKLLNNMKERDEEIEKLLNNMKERDEEIEKLNELVKKEKVVKKVPKKKVAKKGNKTKK